MEVKVRGHFTAIDQKAEVGVASALSFTLEV